MRAMRCTSATSRQFFFSRRCCRRGCRARSSGRSGWPRRSASRCCWRRWTLRSTHACVPPSRPWTYGWRKVSPSCCWRGSPRSPLMRRSTGVLRGRAGEGCANPRRTGAAHHRRHPRHGRSGGARPGRPLDPARLCHRPRSAGDRSAQIAFRQNGRLVTWAERPRLRPDIAAALGRPDIGKRRFGFAIALPEALDCRNGQPELVAAFADGRAVSLPRESLDAVCPR